MVDKIFLCVYYTFWSILNIFKNKIRGHSTLHAGKVLGLLTTVLVLDPPNLVCRDLFGSYNCGLKGFHFGDLQFYSVILSILSKNGPKLPEILKIGSKIKVHQNENPSNHSCMTLYVLELSFFI